ncbi:MAG: cyanophycin synthetase [Bryobacterales bacterium]
MRGFAAVHRGPAVTFGFSEGANYRIVSRLGCGRLELPRVREGRTGAGVAFKTKLPGRHNVLNLALHRCGRRDGRRAALFAQAVSSIEPTKMRGRVIERDGFVILDDCYNSNPAAAKAMIDALRQLPGRSAWWPCSARCELGKQSAALHREVGRAAAEAGVALIVGVGGDAKEIVAGAVEAGSPQASVAFFVTAAEPAKR